MFIIEIIGGLGNQMFGYAFSLAIRNHYGDDSAILYTGRFKETSDSQGYELKDVFGINDPVIDDKRKVEHLIDDSWTVWARARRKFFGMKPTYYREHVFRYDPAVFNLDKSRKYIYIQGLWQDELYFKDIRPQVLDKFQFIRELDKQNQDILTRIRNTNSLSLHVRRGDYVSNPQYMNTLGGACSYDYYQRALDHLDNTEPDLSIFVFSDDIEWVKANLHFLKGRDTTFIDHNKGLNSYIDMQLMSNCKHNIIANSTFSWWGAWLNQNPDKKVLAPKQWFLNSPGYDVNHIVPDDWIKIDNI